MDEEKLKQEAKFEITESKVITQTKVKYEGIEEEVVIPHWDTVDEGEIEDGIRNRYVSEIKRREEEKIKDAETAFDL